MTYTQKIIKEAKEEGRKVDPEVIKGLRAIEKLHNMFKKYKGSLTKTWEKVHLSAR